MASLVCSRAICSRQLRGRAAPISITTVRSYQHIPPKTSRISHLQSTPYRPTTVLRIQNLSVSGTTTTRHSSTSTPASSTTTSEDILTWDRFFDLRRKRRYINLGSSFATAAGSIFFFGPIIANQDLDGWASQVFPAIDSIYVLGGTVFLAAVGGWLCGPSFGSAVFKIWAGRKGWNTAIAEKEKSFYARIKRYRADPASSSPQNPIPDYYGEKIASVKDYRRWLKDQRAFNLKKNKNML